MRHALHELRILIRGSGDLATGIAHRLFRAHMQVVLTDLPYPLCIRRTVAFSQAMFDGEAEVEGVVATRISGPEEVAAVWKQHQIPLLADPEARCKAVLKPQVIVDAIIAKRNLGTKRDDAPLVIGCGPGFQAGVDVDAVIETNRGHNLGKVLYQGSAAPDTGIQGVVAGHAAERVLRAPRDGSLRPVRRIGDLVHAGDVVAYVEEDPMITTISGVVRGLLPEGAAVQAGLKSGDVDPRGIVEHCYTISDKARAIGGGVLEAILGYFNHD
jgi:xanthine dehydrogenase accessory factor